MGSVADAGCTFGPLFPTAVRLHLTTGYSSLLSDAAIMRGGTIAKALIKVPIPKKVPVALLSMGFTGRINKVVL